MQNPKWLHVLFKKKHSFHVYFLTVYFSYNKRQLSRIYPKGTRVGSENYMPQVSCSLATSHAPENIAAFLKFEAWHWIDNETP